MANITAADIGYTKVDSVVSAPGRTRSRWKLVVPNTTNITYPAGGVPINAPLMVGPRGIMAACKVIGQTPVAGINDVAWNWNGNTTAPTLVALESNQATAGVASPLQEYVGTLAQNALTLTLEVENG